MKSHTSLLWLLGPPVALILTGFVYYAKFAWARNWVDSHIPWVRTHIGNRISPLEQTQVIRLPAYNPPRQAVSNPQPPPLVAEFTPPPPAPPPPPPPTFINANGSLDLEKLAANKDYWPKVIELRKPTGFPAVVAGKVVGTLQAPARTEVNLKLIKDGKLGVEYKGGGGWVPVEDTDLAARMTK